MFQKALRMIDQHHMLQFGVRIGVAVSGGADSVFLLLGLAEARLASAVLHVNHHLRGAESDEDEQFVGRLAGSLGIPFHVEHAGLQLGNVEQEARLARLQFFSRLLDRGLVDAVATGHTRDDQAETVLYRFLRGSGTAGLSGIRPVTQTRLIRPLLDLSREEVRASLREKKVAWREDCSNGDTQFARNRIRLELLPELSKFANSSLRETLAGTAQWAQSEEDYWKLEISRLAPSCLSFQGGSAIVDTAILRTLPIAVQRRLLRFALETVRGDLRSIDFRHIEAVRHLAESCAGSGRVQVPGVDAMLSFDLLRVAPLGYDGRMPRNFEAVLQIPGTTGLPERGVAVSMEPVTDRNVYNNQVNAFDWDPSSGALLLRNWQPGDRFHRVGRPGAEKIKTIFQEFRIPLWERRGWPVIAFQQPGSASGQSVVRQTVVGQTDVGQTVVWMRRFGVSADRIAAPISTRAFRVQECTEFTPVPAELNPAQAVSQLTESNCNLQASIEVTRTRGFGFQSSGKPGAEVL